MLIFRAFRSFLQVQFLNLMSLLEARSGRVNVRVGGNTQEFAWYVDDISTGAVIAKESIDATNPVSSITFTSFSSFHLELLIIS